MGLNPTQGSTFFFEKWLFWALCVVLTCLSMYSAAIGRALLWSACCNSVCRAYCVGFKLHLWYMKKTYLIGPDKVSDLWTALF